MAAGRRAEGVAKKKKIAVNLALQGGGAHGAFTWGVLDRLLETGEFEVAAISGTSAGAVNGAALKAGLVRSAADDDPDEGNRMARANLDWLWEQMGAIPDTAMSHWLAPFAPPAELVSKLIEFSPLYWMQETAARVASPYSFGPLYDNPLRKVVETFDYTHVCHATGPDFFVSATNVRTGRIRVFRGEEITPEVILASACLPTLFRAVEAKDPVTLTDEFWWDGGYTGNPALFPLYAAHLPDDVIIININPLEREELPQTPQDIANRVNEISFNASLMSELRAIAFVQRLIDSGTIPEGAMKYVRVHMISDDDLMNDLSVATKTVPNPYVLSELKEAGRRAAARFLNKDAGKVGKESSIDLAAIYGEGLGRTV
ncbi:patatin-like phospholipase family protein [Vannielia litorea]|uniref:patatin-like phospholipase family protein n=1 Tax=Vannielia litorea TaxID=1217970 RepID=UPI001BCE09A0|nr:patatin-like phospholipase family protein [Vannielia litorea]MBS8225285.1 patatin-like phospholipase family protein [Vannielia litorea]